MELLDKLEMLKRWMNKKYHKKIDNIIEAISLALLPQVVYNRLK
jgi:hypothetical protein